MHIVTAHSPELAGLCVLMSLTHGGVSVRVVLCSTQKWEVAQRIFDEFLRGRTKVSRGLKL